MITLKDLKQTALFKESENIKFRKYLKTHANEKELDQHFLDLHNELFKNYDCNECRNCCKEYHSSFEDEKEIELASNSLNIKKDEFISTYLVYNQSSNSYQSINKPCDFLKDGSCLLNKSKPQGCTEFPYTNKPKRLSSLYSVLDAVEVCPVAFEIWERLKQIYEFKTQK